MALLGKRTAVAGALVVILGVGLPLGHISRVPRAAESPYIAPTRPGRAP